MCRIFQPVVVVLCVCFLYVVPTPVQAVFVKSLHNHPSPPLTFQKGATVAREGRKCHDFCRILPDWCRNGGTCITDETTCIGSCICSPSWTGQRCDTKGFVHPSPLPAVSVGITNHTKLDNLSGNEARQENGIQNNSNSTLFSNNVVAMLHDKEDTDSTHGHIKEENTETSIRMAPANHMEHTVGIANLTEVSLTTLSSDNDFSLKGCTRTCIKGDCVKINNVYKCKHRIDSSISTVEKTCGPGFVCVHGVCDMEAKERNSYDCICEGNYVGQFCDHECPFDCGQHGFCDYDVSIKLYKCFCQWNYTGYNCSQLIPTETELMSPDRRVSFHWYVLGASLTLVMVILAGSLLAGYFLWKKRLVFVLKIVHFFKEYEDEDGKEFDAFVSYRSTEQDEKFVLTELFPRLEGCSKFKLCLHFRDFEPGEAIANNIVRAIENSRRTIMILSPAYVKSEWCRLEYQKAQHEMLKLKHRIIPIVLEDIGEVYKDLDTNLKSILNSVTYLEWPGSDESDKKVERFWKKLELSLPKKSSSSVPISSSSSSSSESSESSSTSSDPLSDTSIPLPSVSAHTNSSKPALTLSIPTVSTSCPDKSSNTIKSSPKTYQRRRKDFRHFIDRFVRNSSLFIRQDSNSSQLALVDEETTGSRSSCDSASESNLTESTESICSTPATALTYLDETMSEIGESHSYFSLGLNKCGIEGQKRGALCDTYRYRDAYCINCNSIAKNQGNGQIPQTDICGGTHVEGGECEICKLEHNRSDNNQVKISAIEGTDQIRIQRLPGVDEYSRCNHGFQRTMSYRGNLKNNNRPDAMNEELPMLNRAGTLPRNFRSKIIAKREHKLGEGDIVDDNNRATLNRSDSVSEATTPEVDAHCELSEPSSELESIKTDKTFSSNGYSCIESEDSYETYNGLISIESGDRFSNDGSLC